VCVPDDIDLEAIDAAMIDDENINMDEMKEALSEATENGAKAAAQVASAPRKESPKLAAAVVRSEEDEEEEKE